MLSELLLQSLFFTVGFSYSKIWKEMQSKLHAKLMLTMLQVTIKFRLTFFSLSGISSSFVSYPLLFMN